jgi:hypothetical protein
VETEGLVPNGESGHSVAVCKTRRSAAKDSRHNFLPHSQCGVLELSSNFDEASWGSCPCSSKRARGRTAGGAFSEFVFV